jgi:methylenetetrahydrofolate--tRNA-(uracil-5-)-methyltransferase
LLGHITGGHLSGSATFQPMNVNFGLFPPLEQAAKRQDRKKAMSARALTALDQWLGPEKMRAA